MQRRNFITALFAVPALGLLAACGSDSNGDSLQTSDTTGEPSPEPVATPPDTAVPGAPVSDELILSYTTPGGFTTAEYAFQNPPIVLLTGDGTLIEAAPVPAVYPGPLLPQHQTQTVSPTGIEALLAAAEAAGLFAEVDYSSDEVLLIADAPTSRLTITANGTTYTHEAYALGIGQGPGGESTPERQALFDFLTALQSDPASVFGSGNLSASTFYEPEAYQLFAVPAGDLSRFDQAPTVQPWPAESGIDLATATECAEVDSASVGEVLKDANQLTFFTQNDVTYQVTARPAYPGRSC